MTKGCYFDYMQLHKFYFQGMMRPLLQIKVWKFLMSQIGNHAFMQKFVELLNSASPKLAVELIAPDAVFNSVITGREHTGPSGYLEILAALKAGFPDVRWELQELVGEGNVVAARFNISGTHLGEFQGIKPDGKEVRISAMNLYRLKSGKVVKEFNQFDNLSLLWQIGVYPPME